MRAGHMVTRKQAQFSAGTYPNARASHCDSEVGAVLCKGGERTARVPFSGGYFLWRPVFWLERPTKGWFCSMYPTSFLWLLASATKKQ